MLDLAWPEIAVVGVVALIAIGPKDLPKAMYAVGRWAGKARAFAEDMHRALEQLSFEAEVREKKKADPPSSEKVPDKE